MITHTDRLDHKAVADLANQLRVDSIRCTNRAGSGHPTSAMSAADLFAVLVGRHLNFDWSNPKAATNDVVILSKGHASSLFYSALKATGSITDEELMSYRSHGSRLQGHPTPDLPWVTVATGSLGQGFPIAVGVALANREFDHARVRVWALCGDGELAEGSMWEAADRAGALGLENITPIFDINRLGQTSPTAHGWEVERYARCFAAFGWEPLVINGHNIAEIDDAFETATRRDRPTAILARTLKGKGIPNIENELGWHGKALTDDMTKRAIAQLSPASEIRIAFSLEFGRPAEPAPLPATVTTVLPRYNIGESIPIRRAMGETLAALGVDPRVVVIDGDVCSSTFTSLFRDKHPERFLQMHIAEQQMVATAAGFATRGYRPVLATFAAFFTRAYDFIRMSALSELSILIVGSHPGVEIGRDGASQMGLEDLAMMRAIRGSTVLYPSDAISMSVLMAEAIEASGIVYVRSTRGAYPVLPSANPEFRIGGSRLFLSSADDRVTLVGAGVTVHECLRASDILAEAAIPARVVDMYSVKPIDTETLLSSLSATSGRLVVAEDHHPQGGLGAAVFETLAPFGAIRECRHLAVRKRPDSGAREQQLDNAEISARHIAAAAREIAEE
ncbi:MAG: transketolase [Pseudomonadota bacterium]|nr:transketolase [Pseudomonadota bacterium]